MKKTKKILIYGGAKRVTSLRELIFFNSKMSDIKTFLGLIYWFYVTYEEN